MADEIIPLTSFPTLPRHKPTSSSTTTSPESKYWKSFKTHPIPNLVAGVTSISFSPAHPHLFAATHSSSLSVFNPSTFALSPPISFPYVKEPSFSASFRSDGKLLAASSQSGIVQIFNVKSRTRLRQLRDHSSPVRLAAFPHSDLLHLLSGGDDSLVKYWDVASETKLSDLIGHKDYVRSGCGSPIDDNLFATGSYDHTVRLWDVRVSGGSGSAVVIDHGRPVEAVVFLPSGGMIVTAGGNTVKIWDVVGGGRCLHSMESHNKTVTSVCVGRVGRDFGEESDQYRLLSVSLDGYLKVFDYGKMRTTFSMRFMQPLMSVGVSPDCLTRAVGTANGILYVGRRKAEKKEEGGDAVGFGERRGLKPSFFRYFHRGQGEKARAGDFVVGKPKKVKVAEHDRMLRKFRHKEALVSVLGRRNPETVMAVMEELVARKKLMKCVSNLDEGELELLLGCLQKYCTSPRFAGFLMDFANKVLRMRAEDVRSSKRLMGHVRNLKRAVQEEVRIQESLTEIQGIISPLMRIAGR